MLGAAVGRVAIERGRRRRSAECSFVAHRCPQPPGLGAAPPRREHFHGSVVGVQHFAGADVLTDRNHQRIEQRCHASHPIRHGGAVEIDILPRVDVALPIERQPVGVFRHDDMREQARTGPAALDRQRR